MAPIIGAVSHQNKEERIDFSWETPDFFARVEDKECIWRGSPHISFLNCNWQLCFSVEYLQNGKDLVLVLIIVRPCSGNKTVCCTVSLQNSDGTAVKSTTKTHTFSEKDFHLEFYLSGTDLSYLQKHRSKLVPSGTLTIKCSMQYSKIESQASEQDASKPVVDWGRLSTDFKGLLQSGDDSDATIRVKEREFRVHRAILRARTPVFSAMFSHDMAERASGVVDIEDSEPDTVGSFLEYVYSGQVECLTPENATSLYEVADKYQVEPLKEKCLDCIKGGLSVEIFCRAVTLAMKHDENGLTTLATRFFADNKKEIVRTDSWKKFLYENPAEANELLMKLFDME